MWLEKEKDNYNVEKKAMEGMIQILKVQIKQLKEETKNWEQLFQEMQWKDEKIIKGEDGNHKNGELPEQYSFHKIKTAKENLDRNIVEFMTEKGIPAELQKVIGMIIFRYHEEVVNEFRELEADLKNEKRLNSLIGNELDLEQQNEDLLVDAVSSLQDQISQLVQYSDSFFHFCIGCGQKCNFARFFKSKWKNTATTKE